MRFWCNTSANENSLRDSARETTDLQHEAHTLTGSGYHAFVHLITESAIDTQPLLAGVEMGGTKCVCLLGTGPEDIRVQASVPTGRDAALTLARVEGILRDSIAQHGAFHALGIASFGPIDLSTVSPTYGYITSTPKPGWKNTSVAKRLGKAFQVPVGFDTDVNGAALAEGRWGAAQGLKDFAYITVGTGVGAGLIANGQLIHGFAHPELGHIRIARRAGDTWPGSCVYHGDCVEGLASGVAIAARAGVAADQLASDSPVWDLVAHAIAQLAHSIMLTTAPKRILIGGGVMESRPQLFPAIRSQLLLSIGEYLETQRLVGDVNSYITPPGLGALTGPLGALALAADTRQRTL
jgi:fructokinase